MAFVQEWKGVEVSYKELWDDDWTVEPNLICLRLTRSLGHQIDQATLLWRQGEMFNPGDIAEEGSLLFKQRNSPIGDRYYIRLRRLEEPFLLWWGIVVGEEWPLAGKKLDGVTNSFTLLSDKLYTVMGLEWLMDRNPIVSTVHHPDERISHPLGFNYGLGDGRGASFEDRGNRDTRKNGDEQWVFAVDNSFKNLWFADQIVEHLLYYHAPNDGNNPSAPAPVTFGIDSETYAPFLEWFTPTVAVEGRTLYAVLNDIITARRGLVWWLEYPLLGNTVFLNVNSTTPTIINLPAENEEEESTTFIPAALNQSPLNFDALHEVRDARYASDSSRRYNRIRVRGSKRTATFTVSTKDENLEPAWTSAAETDYIEAGGATNKDKADRYRQAEKLKAVYQDFRIPKDWDGKSRDGSGTGEFEFSCPKLSSTGSVLGAETIVMANMRLLRTLPLRDGWDYEHPEEPVEGSRETSSDPDFTYPLGIVKHGDKWVFLDRSADHIDEDDSETTRLKTSYHFALLQGTNGFELRSAGGLPHALAKNHFDTATPAPSKTDAEIDYEECRFTVAAEWDAYCEFVFPPVGNILAKPREGDAIEELLINIGDRARWDYLVEGTVYDVQDGAIKKAAESGSVRDDRRDCEILAQAAYAWYKQPRGSFGVSFADYRKPVELGDLVTVLGDAMASEVGANIEVNAIVTQILYSPEEGRIAIQGGFAELDFGGLV